MHGGGWGSNEAILHYLRVDEQTVSQSVGRVHEQQEEEEEEEEEEEGIVIEFGRRNNVVLTGTGSSQQ